MSRRGNPYDNAMAENFFSILKTECIYPHKPATFSEANEMIDRYILISLYFCGIPGLRNYSHSLQEL